MHLRRSFFLALLLTALSPIAHAAVPAGDNSSATPFRREALLARGINLSNWFASSSDLSAEHIAKHTTSADLALIHSLGFTYVRIGIDPAQFTKSGMSSPNSTAALQRLDHAIDDILGAHLAVSLCIFPTDDYKRTLSTSDGASSFINLWRLLAQHYASIDPDHVFFEIINEPEADDAYRWDGLQASVVSAIRQQDLAHTLIATASHYSGLSDLLRVQPVRDPNVIYNFHFYEPYPFTHQGATWGSFEWNFYKDIPYPATPESLAAALEKIPEASARYILFLYGSAGWNQQTILARLRFARDWADANHVPVICDEFGAYRDKAPADSRARYIHDVRASLEQLHIGWAMWDYSGNFGLVSKTAEGQTTPDAATVEALGLTPAK